MKIQFIKPINSSLTVGLAQITDHEPEKWEKEEKKYLEITSLHSNKKLEFLAIRRLLEQVCEKKGMTYHGIKKDSYGKPHLINSSYHLSLSHSYPYVCCCLHTDSSCGIDIESAKPQLLRVRHKFLNDNEYDFCGENLDKLCLHWAAKETLYKIYGRKKVIFSENLIILALSYNAMHGVINMNGVSKHYQLRYEKIGEYFMVHSI